MKISITTAWIISIICFFFVWPLGLIGMCISLYITIQNKKGKEHQREIELKEIDMVRKSNEILLHLIQDEHREEGDR
ncbi:MAG: hypothetical protein HFG05_09195 [Oscillibacter sp.]|nr:hypothetical protein [Oscillibacter sp.]